MAIYTTQKSQTYATVIGQGGSRNIVREMVSVALTTAMIDNANDEVELFWVPKGAVICGIQARSTDIDTDGSPGVVLDIGDDGDEDRLLAAATIGQAATRSDDLAVAGWGYKYTTATKIKAYVKTAAVAGAAGTLYVALDYFIDENFTLANAVVS